MCFLAMWRMSSQFRLKHFSPWGHHYHFSSRCVLTWFDNVPLLANFIPHVRNRWLCFGVVCAFMGLFECQCFRSLSAHNTLMSSLFVVDLSDVACPVSCLCGSLSTYTLRIFRRQRFPGKPVNRVGVRVLSSAGLNVINVINVINLHI